MRNVYGWWVACVVLTSACSAVEPAQMFRDQLAAAYRTADEAGALAVPGEDGWLFPSSELRFLSTGPFWGASATAVSRAMKPTSSDPVPGIVGFHRALRDRGIELIVLPVPAKAAVYPDKISSLPGGVRYDSDLQAFYAVLRSQGVHILDLTDAFMAMEEQAYCRTDTHWSPAACRVAATEIAALIADRPWLSGIPKVVFTSEQFDIAFTGDLGQALAADPSPGETLPFARISKVDGDAELPVAGNETSPIILMGDSHTLVFQDGSLLAAQGGLPDLLARELGVELDLQFRNKGSGSSVVRKSLARKQIMSARAGQDYLAGKKLVIWCFTARDFTEATDGWPVMPIERK